MPNEAARLPFKSRWVRAALAVPLCILGFFSVLVLGAGTISYRLVQSIGQLFLNAGWVALSTLKENWCEKTDH